jgi:hypothetical protein
VVVCIERVVMWKEWCCKELVVAEGKGAISSVSTLISGAGLDVTLRVDLVASA